ncbi:hypothetical protein AVEN_104936-1 [Araneus ventricosus]|uniref:Uncharacterized protein n=1 Tax=Araneus ventricosus TaxID=182803 RepID=A0A4Y2SPP3_ARAVE|nr:hypothetical protein AVEN_104936-1 [Araneus ventricosus]
MLVLVIKLFSYMSDFAAPFEVPPPYIYATDWAGGPSPLGGPSSDKRNPPVLYTDPGLLISKIAFLSTTCKKSHHYFSLVSTLPTKVNVAPRPSNPRLVTLNCPVPFT